MKKYNGKIKINNIDLCDYIEEVESGILTIDDDIEVQIIVPGQEYLRLIREIYESSDRIIEKREDMVK